jgi:hypothetical protein
MPSRKTRISATQPARSDLAVSHRERLIGELRADLEFAAEYLKAAAAESDPRASWTARRTVAAANAWPKRKA